MPTRDPRPGYLKRLQDWRTRPDKDLSLGFLKKQFKQQVEKPHKQLGKLAELWAQLVPKDLAAQTRLDGLSRGVLHVSVLSSSALYELDRVLRTGVEQKLRESGAAPTMRRIQLRTAANVRRAK